MKSDNLIKSLEKAVPPYYLITDNMKDELKVCILMFVMSILITILYIIFVLWRLK